MKLAGLPVVAALLVSACDAGDADKPAPPKHTPEDVSARADEVYATFRTWHDNLPAVTADARACDDAEIAEFGTEKNRIDFLAYQSLRHTLGEPWDGKNSTVRFMTGANLRYAQRDKFDLTKERNIKQLMRMWGFVEYVGVVVPTHERKAKALGPTAGSGGAVRGQLVIYRKGKPDPLCHTPFEVDSQGGTSYRVDVSANSSEKQRKAAYALKKKTCSDLKSVLTDRIAALTKTLKPGLIDCNAV